MTDIRWKQRFDNFSKAGKKLDKFVSEMEGNPDSETNKLALIQVFEFTFELAWKTLKDYLTEEGFSDAKSPRSAIKVAFNNDFILGGQVWIDMLADRNLMSHAYDEDNADLAVDHIMDSYHEEINLLIKFFEERINE